jgi:hypothetical protein
VDTIEPYKRSKRLLDINLLNQIELEILEDRIVISSNIKSDWSDAILFQAENLKNWLTRTKRNGDSVEIFIK